jgi:hypothetical protein
VEVVRLQSQTTHLRLRDLNARTILSLVEVGFYPQASDGAGGSDQIDDGLERSQGLASPVLRDVTEEGVDPTLTARWRIS